MYSYGNFSAFFLWKEAYAEILSCLSHWEPRNLPRLPQLWARWSDPFMFQIFPGCKAKKQIGLFVFLGELTTHQSVYGFIWLLISFFSLYLTIEIINQKDQISILTNKKIYLKKYSSSANRLPLDVLTFLIHGFEFYL